MDYGQRFEHFSLKWNNFHNNMKAGFHELLTQEDLVDVTIAVEGKLIQAHKMVLSVCSPYFKNIFKTNPCQHPVVFLKDVSQKELSGILQFMYLGEVSVQQEELGHFLKTAESLQIKGLTGDDEDDISSDSIKPEEVARIPNLKQDEPPDKISSSNGIKRLAAPTQDARKRRKQTPPPPPEVDISDEDELPVDSLSQSLNVSSYDISEDSATSNVGNNHSGSGKDVMINSSALQANGNQEIRFVMSQRMRPCLVFNNYLYIKDHVGVALPGQPKTIYWRCKDIACKARVIQTDFRFRLKKNSAHQHLLPDIDKTYLPINIEEAYEIIKFLI